MNHEEFTVFVADAERNQLLKKCEKLGIDESAGVAVAIKHFIKKPA